MECKFTVGQKVVCVDAVNSPNCYWLDGEVLTTGAVYTVSDILINPNTGNVNMDAINAIQEPVNQWVIP